MPERDTGGGAMEDEFIPLGVSLRSPLKDGEAFRSNQKIKISWTIRTDESYLDLDPGFYSCQVVFSKDRGVTWLPPAPDAAAIVGASCATQEECQNKGLISYLWTVPADWEGDQYRVKIVAYNIKGQPHDSNETRAFIVDNTPPTISAQSFTINGKKGDETNPILIRNPNASLGVAVTDNLTPITHFCLSPGTAANACNAADSWKKILIPSKSVSFEKDDLRYFLGVMGGSFTFYLWFRDAAGNETQLSNEGLGTAGTDKQTVIFSPGVALKFTKFFAGNNNEIQSPPEAKDLVFDAQRNTVFIRWGYQWINDGKATSEREPITLSYSLDGRNKIQISTAREGNNGQCRFNESLQETGCFEWKNIPFSLFDPIPKPFFLHIEVEDEFGGRYTQVSHVLNGDNFRTLAGNIQSGIGGNATEAVVNLLSSGLYGEERFDNQSVIDDEGSIFVYDPNRGILKVDPTTGIIDTFITKASASVDGFINNAKTSISGNIKMSPSYNPLAMTNPDGKLVKIANPLIIFENTRVRRITLRPDPSDGNRFKPYLETFIGYNGLSGTGTTRGNQTARCVVTEMDGKKIVASANLTKTTDNPDPLWSCQLNSTDITKGYRIFYSKTDPEKLYLNTDAVRAVWSVLPNGSIFFLNNGLNALAKNADIRLYKFDKTENKYRVFPILLTGKGMLSKCNGSGNPSGCTKLSFDSIANMNFMGGGFSFNPTSSVADTLSVRMRRYDASINDWVHSSTNLNPYSGIANGPNTHYPWLHGVWWYGGLFNSWKGELHTIHTYTSSLYRINASTATWITLLGDGYWGNRRTCPDGTPALQCHPRLQSAFTNSQSSLFFWDNFQLRAIDNNKNIVTLLGKTKTDGDGVDPLIARIGNPEYLSIWTKNGKDRVTFFDKLALTVREIDEENSLISTIAGNGDIRVTYTYANNSTTEVASKLAINLYPEVWGRDFFWVDRKDGTVLSTDYQNGSGMIKLNRTTGKWERIFGATALSPQKRLFGRGTDSCDDKDITNCLMRTVTSNNWVYSPMMMGYAPEQTVDSDTRPAQLLLMTNTYQDAVVGHVRCYVKSYFPTLNKIQHFMGNDNACSDQTYSSSPISMENSNKFPTFYSPLRMQYSAYEDGWFTSSTNDNKIYLIRNVRDPNKNNQVVKAGIIEVKKNLNNPLISFGVVDTDYDNPTFFYCSTSGKLYKTTLLGTEVQLALPEGYTCTGKSIEISGDGNRVIFPFSKNSLKGIGEYVFR